MNEAREVLALQLAAQGMPIIPVHPGSKIPALHDWPTNGSTDEVTIREWFQNQPDMNYGVVTGHGCIVLDIDIKNGKNGMVSLTKFCEGDMPVTLTTKTPSGGYHYYFSTSERLRKKNFSDGIDFQALGQFAVGPGSAIDGKGDYEIFLNAPIAPIPDWLLQAIASKQASRKATQP